MPVKTAVETPPLIQATDIVFLRVLVETRGSFRDFEAWVGASAALASVAAASTAHAESFRHARVMNRSFAKRGVETLAAVERALTHELAMASGAFRLQADGQGRTYQVELGMLLWRLPRWGSWLFQNQMACPWLIQLGDRGPWLVDRVICGREMPANLDTAAKVDMVSQSVLRVCTGLKGDVNVDLHRHVTSRILSWASDGADLPVGHACTTHFKNMVFREWEESHSSAKLLEHAIKNHEEARVVDGLLVSGAASAPNLPHAKKPPSLAKFLTTSMVFRKRCSEAQRIAGVALCENFGYAPQRYVSRARPMSRVQRRWEPIWESLAEEAVGSSQYA